MTTATPIPCVISLQRYLAAGDAPPGFALMWTMVNIRFDARDATRPCNVGDLVHLVYSTSPGNEQEFFLTVIELEATDRPHIFSLEAVRVDLACRLEGNGNEQLPDYTS